MDIDIKCILDLDMEIVGFFWIWIVRSFLCSDLDIYMIKYFFHIQIVKCITLIKMKFFFFQIIHCSFHNIYMDDQTFLMTKKRPINYICSPCNILVIENNAIYMPKSYNLVLFSFFS